MFYTAETLGQLRDAINSLIEKFGNEDIRVGTETGKGYFWLGVQLEWIMIHDSKDGKYPTIVGTEANDYKKQENDHDVILIS